MGRRIGTDGTAGPDMGRRERNSTALCRPWLLCTVASHLDHCQLPRRAQASGERVQLKASTDDPGGGGERGIGKHLSTDRGHTHTHTPCDHITNGAHHKLFSLS